MGHVVGRVVGFVVDGLVGARDVLGRLLVARPDRRQRKTCESNQGQNPYTHRVILLVLTLNELGCFCNKREVTGRYGRYGRNGVGRMEKVAGPWRGLGGGFD